MQQLVVVLSGLAGAAGIALAAIGAHGAAGRGLADAGLLLTLHAAAGLALVGLGRATGAVTWLVIALVLLAGAGLFAGDVAARAYLKTRLFPYAAPTGGFTMIAGWLALALLALIRR